VCISHHGAFGLSLQTLPELTAFLLEAEDSTFALEPISSKCPLPTIAYVHSAMNNSISMQLKDKLQTRSQSFRL
jgi:hypothetical protein